MHFSLLIKGDTGLPPVLHSIHPGTPNTRVILMIIPKSHQADTLFERKGRQKHCPPKPQSNPNYKDVFEGLGSFPGMHKIQLKTDIEPVIHPPRKIPIALRDKLEKELNRVEDLQAGAHQMEPPSPTQALGVNPFPSRFINRTVP